MNTRKPRAWIRGKLDHCQSWISWSRSGKGRSIVISFNANVLEHIKAWNLWFIHVINIKWFAMSISVCVYNKVWILEDLEPECILESAQLLEEHWHDNYSYFLFYLLCVSAFSKSGNSLSLWEGNCRGFTISSTKPWIDHLTLLLETIKKKR